MPNEFVTLEETIKGVVPVSNYNNSNNKLTPKKTRIKIKSSSTPKKRTLYGAAVAVGNTTEPNLEQYFENARRGGMFR